jgi:hypothetical protein
MTQSRTTGLLVPLCSRHTSGICTQASIWELCRDLGSKHLGLRAAEFGTDTEWCPCAAGALPWDDGRENMLPLLIKKLRYASRAACFERLGTKISHRYAIGLHCFCIKVFCKSVLRKKRPISAAGGPKQFVIY